MIRIALASLCIVHSACTVTELKYQQDKKEQSLQTTGFSTPANLDSKNILQTALSFFGCRTFSAEAFWLFEDDDDAMLQDALGDLQMGAAGEYEDMLY